MRFRVDKLALDTTRAVEAKNYVNWRSGCLQPYPPAFSEDLSSLGGRCHRRTIETAVRGTIRGPTGPTRPDALAGLRA